MSKIFRNEPGYKRISSKEEYTIVANKFLNYVEEVKSCLGRLFLKIETPKELYFKTDFGDIDFIVLLDETNSWIKHGSFIDAITRTTLFNGTHIEKSFKNGDCLSLLFVDENKDKYHIDIIITGTKEKYNNYLVYYCNSVVNNFLGQFLKSVNIKAGHNGVYYIYKDKRGDTIKILLEKNYNKFFIDYFNMDLLSLEFYSFEQLIEFLINVEFFPGSKRYLDHRSSDKKRALKMHGLMNEIYITLGNLTEPKYVDNDYQLKLREDHQIIVDEYIKLHELKKDINAENRKALFEFLESQNIGKEFYQDVFKNMMPILNQVKYTKHNILEELNKKNRGRKN